MAQLQKFRISKCNKSFHSRFNYAPNRNLKCTRCGHSGHLVNTCYVNLNRSVSKFNSNTSNFDSNVNNRKNFHGKKKFLNAHSLEYESSQNFFMAKSSLNFSNSSGEIC